MIHDIGDRIHLALFAATSLLCFNFLYAEESLQDILAKGNANAQMFKEQLNGVAKDVQKIHQKQMQMLPEGQNPETASLSQVRTVVFLSRSMPENTTISLLNDGAGKNDTLFIYRGWGRSRGLNEMFAYAEKLHKKLSPSAQKTPPNIMVYPAAFEAYQIQYVPAVLHKDNDEKWYLVQGAISLEGSIRAIQERRFDRRLSQQYAVIEPDQAKVMSEKMKNHDWESEAKQAVEEIQQQTEGVIDLPHVTKSNTTEFIPYEPTTYDVRSPKTGQIIYPKGTQFNLLSIDPSGKRQLLAIDGRNDKQIALAKKMIHKQPEVIILYTKLGAIGKAGFYAMPLNQSIAKRLHIRAVPTLISQRGLKFVVKEIKLE